MNSFEVTHIWIAITCSHARQERATITRSHARQERGTLEAHKSNSNRQSLAVRPPSWRRWLRPNRQFMHRSGARGFFPTLILVCRACFIPLILAALQSNTAIHSADPTLSSIQFSRDVLPILAENCFACHGFDESSRQADLRLDTRENAIATKDGVTPVMPGKPESSALWSRIISTDSDEIMPPEKTGKHLSATQ